MAHMEVHSKGSLKRMCMMWTPTTLIFLDMEQGECVTVPVAQDLAALCSFFFFRPGISAACAFPSFWQALPFRLVILFSHLLKLPAHTLLKAMCPGWQSPS